MSIKPETLEALLLDRDAGALSPETDELLATYLELEPASAKEAGEFLATLELTKKAFALEKIRSLPKPAFLSSRDSVSWVPWRTLAPWLAAAACLAVGFYMGRFDTLRPLRMAAAVMPEKSPTVQTKPVLGTHESSFWSSKNLWNSTNEIPRQSAYTIVWDSPLKRPRIKSSY